jgi:predicted DCC family thiol-disulfide oxidoreductase YuxK
MGPAATAPGRDPATRVALVIYDAECGLCRWSLAKLLAWDRGGRLRAVALQDAEADRLLGGMSEEERMGSWHLVTPAGGLRSAGAAFPPLFELLPGGRRLASLARRFPEATQRVYEAVSRHRGRLGRLIPQAAVRRADRRIRERSRAIPGPPRGGSGARGA